MRTFIKGLPLCEGFFNEVAKPLLAKHFKNLEYTAGLIGYGSDVLGYDDEVSTDHMWGPRFYLFLKGEDIKLKGEILEMFCNEFPYEYRGYSVNFSAPDPNDGGVRHAEFISFGKVSPLVFIHSFEEYLEDYLGVKDIGNIDEWDWLAFSEHRLLALTSGKLFVDGLKIGDTLKKLSFYPDYVKLYLIASNWEPISQEQAFVKRCHDVGDDIGSAIVCSRIAERLMRLCFLYCDRYAPYSKWFGKAFSLLPIEDEIKTAIHNAVLANNIKDREDNISLAQKLVADLHNSLKLTDPVEVKIQDYFGRDIKVIFAGNLVDATLKKISGTSLSKCPPIGTMSEVANLVCLSDEPAYRNNIKALYKTP